MPQGVREKKLRFRRARKKGGGFRQGLFRRRPILLPHGRFTCRAQIVEGSAVCRGQFGVRQRRKRRAILEVDGDGAKDDLCPSVSASLQYILQVAGIAPINHFLSRVIWRNFILQKHFHAMPGFSLWFAQFMGKIQKQLAKARPLDG